MINLSKTQIDRLGERLRKDVLDDSDLKALDDYRRSFNFAYSTVTEIIRNKLNLKLTGRPNKSTSSIREKLRRESIRLSQMQDIAGCRIVVPDILEQDHVSTLISNAFDDIPIMDRRVYPSHNYRAVHIIVKLSGKLIEIQNRTTLQHAWAELSEKLSDNLDSAIKYGQGNKEIQGMLGKLSHTISKMEDSEKELRIFSQDHKFENELFNLQKNMNQDKTQVIQLLEDIKSMYKKRENR